jgi:hypothetical protein
MLWDKVISWNIGILIMIGDFENQSGRFSYSKPNDF